MKRGTTTYLKVVIFIMGMFVLVLCTLWLPWLAKDLAAMNPAYAYLKFPVFIYLNIASIFLALYQAWNLLNYIDSENAFLHRSVISLG